MKNKIIKIITDQLRAVSPDIENATAKTGLYGADGILDSLGLVGLIVGVESDIVEEFDRSITIADEKALSQKNSPFRTVGSLADYIEILLSETADE